MVRITEPETNQNDFVLVTVSAENSGSGRSLFEDIRNEGKMMEIFSGCFVRYWAMEFCDKLTMIKLNFAFFWWNTNCYEFMYVVNQNMWPLFLTQKRENSGKYELAAKNNKNRLWRNFDVIPYIGCLHKKRTHVFDNFRPLPHFYKCQENCHNQFKISSIFSINFLLIFFIKRFLRQNTLILWV